MAGLGLPQKSPSGGFLGAPGAKAPGLGLPAQGLGMPMGFSPTGGTDYTGWGKVSGFGVSILESFPEMFGIEPGLETQAFRAQAPVSGFLSQLVGWAIPYMGASRAIGAVPALSRVVAGAEALGTNAFTRGALKWGTEAAMIEAARLGIAATPIPEAIFGRERTESAGDMLAGAGFNIVGGAALGGVGKVIGARLAKGPKIYDIVPDAHPSFPLVARIRALDDAIKTGKAGNVPLTEDLMQTLSYQREQLKRANFADIDPAYTPNGYARISTAEGAVYNGERGQLVAPLVGQRTPASGRALNETLNTMMNPLKRNVGRVAEARLLTLDPERGMVSQGELDDVFKRIGLDRDTLSLVGQNQRILRVNTGSSPTGGSNAAKALDNLFMKRGKGAFARVADDWFIAREEGNGLWVAAKKIKGSLKTAAHGDEWFVMKTDQPNVLDPQAAAFKELTVNRSAYFPKRGPADDIGVDVYDAANQWERTYEAALVRPAKTGKSTRSRVASGMRSARDAVAEVAVPTSALGDLNPRAGYIVGLMKTLTDMEEAIIGGIMQGAREAKPNDSIIKQLATLGESYTGGLKQFIYGMSDAARKDFKEVLEMEVDMGKVIQMANAGLIEPQAFQLLQALDNLDQGFIHSVDKLKEHVGADAAVALANKLNARRGHFGQTRTRTGSVYMLLDDAQTGRRVGMVAGETAEDATKRASDYIREQAKRGRDLSLGGMYDANISDEAMLARMKAEVATPGFTKVRGELEGYDLQLNANPGAKDIASMIEGNLKLRQRYITNITLAEKTGEAMRMLMNESAPLANAMQKRLDTLAGKQGPIDIAVNKAVDKVLGGVLGKNSASQIVQVTQRLMTAFQFGFMNLSAPVLNATSMLQVTMPEAAFVLRMAGRDSSNYVTLPWTSEGGHVVGAVNVVSDIKLFWNSMKLLGTSERQLPQDFKDLMQAMVDERLIAPRFAEAQNASVGETLKNVKQAWSNHKDFIEWAGAANEVLMAKSEEMNRSMSVAVAYNVAKMLGIDDAYRMARFTREFVSKTSFNYSTIDRPTMFTSPVGSLAGTFKTWMFHYMANMAKYAGGGRETLAPLLWQTGATAAIGGAAATPLLVPIANAASNWLTDKSFMENVYEGTGMDPMGMKVADTLLYGLPATFGLSLASQSSSPGADPARDASMMFGFAAWDRMRAFGKFAGGAVQAYRATGASPWEDDEVRGQFMKAVAPRTLYRAMSLTQDNAIKSMTTGYRTLDNVSLGSGALYAVGFNPVELDKTYAAYEAVRKDQRAKQLLTAEFGDQLAQAWESGDDVMATRIFTRALATGVDTSSILRSAKSRMERGEETQLGYALGKAKGDTGWEFMVE